MHAFKHLKRGTVWVLPFFFLLFAPALTQAATVNPTYTNGFVTLGACYSTLTSYNPSSPNTTYCGYTTYSNGTSSYTGCASRVGQTGNNAYASCTI
ncbi:MAG: hypothetical protein ACYCPH_03600, partial [Minisyncoccota bacterium]